MTAYLLCKQGAAIKLERQIHIPRFERNDRLPHKGDPHRTEAHAIRVGRTNRSFCERRAMPPDICRPIDDVVHLQIKKVHIRGHPPRVRANGTRHIHILQRTIILNQ